MNKDFKDIVSRSILFSNPETLAELTKFETEKGATIRDIPLEKFLRKETVGVSPTLIETKLLDTVLQGAEHFEIYQNLCKIVPMTSNKYEQPVIGYTDFKSYKGLTGVKGRMAGGLFDVVELDCSDQKGLRRLEVSIDKTWIRDFHFDAISEALQAVGYSIFDDLMATVVAKYLADVDSTMTDTVANWGNTHYKAMVKMVTLIANARMATTMILVHPDEVYDTFILDQFISGLYAERAGKQDINLQTGIAGYLFPNRGIPIYFHPSMTAASMIAAAAQKAIILGIRQELTIENFNDVINGEEGGVVTMQWDVKSGKDAKHTKPTKLAWAVATSA